MTADQLIIEDFDFCQYPITRIYPLGNKTVIQIGEASCETPRKTLLDEINDLKHDCKIFEEEKESAESELEKAESELEKAEKELNSLEEKHGEELDKIEGALESAEHQLGIDTSSRWIQDRIEEFAVILSEKIEELELDNRALASTITDQNEIIANLEKRLDAFTNVN